MQVEPLGAGVLAAALAYAELKTSLRRQRLSCRALHWIMARVGFEGLLATAAYLILSTTMKIHAWPATLLLMLVAGGAATTLLRVNINLMFGKQARQFQLGNRYNHWLKTVSHEIDDINSEAQSRWLWNKVVPKIEVFHLEELRRRSVTYLHAREFTIFENGKSRTAHSAYY
jgi:hypothetical protein